MRIEKVKLINFKSHEKGEFEFTDGINLIIGENGSGKTSIIQALKLAFFGKSQNERLRLRDFIRRNESKAHIEITFTAMDGLRYRLSKEIKEGRGRTVLECLNTGERKVVGVHEISTKLMDLLGIRGSGGRIVYDKVINIYQNQIIDIFSKDQTGNFERIFGIDTYRELEEVIREVLKRYRIRREGLEERMGLLEREIEEMGDVEERLRESIHKKMMMEKLRDEKNEIKEKISRRIEDVESRIRIFERVDEMEKKMKIVEEEMENLCDEIEKMERDMEWMKKNEDKYSRYSILKKMVEMDKRRYEDLERTWKRKLKLKDEFTEKMKELDGLRKDRKYLSDERERLNDEMERMNDEIEKLDEELKNMKERLDRIASEEKEVMAELEKLEKVKEKRDRLKYGIENLENNMRKLKMKVEKEDELKREFDLLSDDLKKIEDEIDRLKRLEIERIELEQSKKLLEEQSHSLFEEGICPILREECVNIKNRKNPRNHLERLLHDYAERMKDMDEELKKMYELEKRRDKLIRERMRINHMLDEISDLKKELKDVVKESKNKENELRKMEKILEENDFEGLKRRKDELSGIMREMEGRMKILFDNLKKMIEERKKMEKEADKINREIEKLNDSIENLTVELRNLEKETEDLEEVSKELEKLRVDLQKKESEMGELEDVYRKYVGILEKIKDGYPMKKRRYGELKKRYEKMKKELEYERSKLKGLTKAQLEEMLGKLKTEKDNLEKEMEGILGELGKMEQMMENLKDQVERKRKRMNEKKEVEGMMKKIEIKMKMMKELGEGVKKLINHVGREITLKLSKMATKIHSEITGKNEEIQWRSNENYRVYLVSADKGEREFNMLSGGEQVSVALSLRLAMAEFLTENRLLILDEPTINLDKERKEMLAQVIGEIGKRMDQVILVTHDDIFESIASKRIEVGV
ncbi:MAG: hypothetical protein DRP30_05955 [Thermotoga sp.]|nr:MAG: hypothetical protein DRP30_05955 [Thermotoga sp.]